MLAVYYTIFFILALMFIPLASKKVTYAYQPHIDSTYDPLSGVNSQTRYVLYAVAVLMLIMLVFFCINKPEDISDNKMYLFYYESGGRHNDRTLEPTFGMITDISPSFLWLLGIYALLSCGSNIYAIFRNSPNIFLSVIIYLSYYYILHDVIQIRVAVSCGLALIAIRYQYERKWLTYFLLIALAMTFHSSAVIFIPLYFLPKKNMNRTFWATLLLVCLILALFGLRIGTLSRYIPLQLVQKYLEAYLGSRTYVASELGPMRVFKCLMIIVMIIRINTIKRHYPYAPMVLCLYTLSLIVYLLMGDIPVLQGRIGELLGISEIFALAMFPLISKKHYYLLLIIPLGIAAYNHMEGLNLLTYSAG